MNYSRAAIVILGGFVLFAAGFGLGVKHGSKQRDAATGARPRSFSEAPVRVRPEADGQHSESRQIAGRPEATGSLRADGSGRSEPAPAAVDAAEWRMMADLQRRKLARPSITFVGASGKLTDAFAQLFALAAAERENLQQAVDAASQHLVELNRIHSTVTRDDDGGVTIVVTSFAQEGGIIYDEMMKAFAANLGPDRYAAFMALGADQVERALGRFGAPEQTVKISRKSGPDGAISYLVEERFKLPQESGTGTADFSSLEGVRSRLGPIAGVLPPDFGSSALPPR